MSANEITIKTEASQPNATVQPNSAVQLVPVNFVQIPMPTQYITHSIAPNPTLPIPPPPTAATNNNSALHALQQRLQTRTLSNSKTEKIPPNPTLTNNYYPNPQYLPVLQQLPSVPCRKDEILAENWTSKIAYAATLSSIINETSKLYKEKAQIQLEPKWTDLLYQNTKKSKDVAQKVFDEAIDHIFKTAEMFLKEISSQMSETKITQSIGMMKGLTDAVCKLINDAFIHLPSSNPSKMRHLFEMKILVMWSTLLLRATTDVRDAMQRYLTHAAFTKFFAYKSALNSEFYKHLSNDEHILLNLRTAKEQFDFEANTRKYVEEANLSLMTVRKITILPQKDRMSKMSDFQNKKRVRWKECNGPKPAKKRRKKSRYQLFRVDGTPRKRQQNPCDRRICKRMWQADGVTRGCGQNSHPRGVCPCWKELGFKKTDEKNGNILKWLEDKYGKPYVL